VTTEPLRKHVVVSTAPADAFEDAGTMVHLEHRHLERYGKHVWEVRGHLDAVIGWRATLDDVAKSFTTTAFVRVSTGR
jgi:hypothetical protein